MSGQDEAAMKCKVKFEEVLRHRGCQGQAPQEFKWLLCRPPPERLEQKVAWATKQALSQARFYASKQPELSKKVECALEETKEETEGGAGGTPLRKLELDMGKPQSVYEVVAVVNEERIGLGILQSDQKIPAVFLWGQQASAADAEDDVPQVLPSRRAATAPATALAPISKTFQEDEEEEEDEFDFGNTNESIGSASQLGHASTWGHGGMPLPFVPPPMMPMAAWPFFPMPPMGPLLSGGTPQPHSSTRNAMTDRSKNETKGWPGPIERPGNKDGNSEHEEAAGDSLEVSGARQTGPFPDYGMTPECFPAPQYFGNHVMGGASWWPPSVPPPPLSAAEFCQQGAAGGKAPPNRSLEYGHKDWPVPRAQSGDGLADRADGAAVSAGQQVEELVRTRDPKQRASPQAFLVTKHGEQTLVEWPVPVKTFDTFNVNHPSPNFEVAFQGADTPSSFMLLIKPPRSNWSKRGANFKKSDGKGAVSLKCTSMRPQDTELRVRIFMSVGYGDQAQESGDREHDFVQNNMYAFKKDQKELWDIKGCEDPETNCVMFRLRIQPQPIQPAT